MVSPASGTPSMRAVTTTVANGLLLGVAVLVFFMLRIVPGDVVEFSAPDGLRFSGVLKSAIGVTPSGSVYVSMGRSVAGVRE